MNDEIIFIIIDSIESSGRKKCELRQKIQIAIENHKFNIFIRHSIWSWREREKLFDTNEYGEFFQFYDDFNETINVVAFCDSREIFKQ